MRTFRENAAWNGMVWPTNVSGDLTTWTYDAASGLVTSKTDAKGKSVNYTYTVDGKLASRTWARGIVTNYTYDSATGKLLKADYSDTTPDITYTYNRSGQIATIQDATGSRTFIYDNTFNQIKETISGIYSKDLNKSYTATGMKGQIQGFAIGEVQNYIYTYDDYGRINKITTPMGDFNYTRLLNSDLISQMTRPNGVASSWSYEDKRNLLTQVQNGSVSDFGYTNNAIGNRTAMSRAGSAFTVPDTISYSYNSRSEVIGAVSNQNSAYNYAYSFDPIGNRLTANLAGTSYNYTTNMLNQYTVVNSNQPTYDDDGNMLTNGSWSYTWNGENRMVQAVNGNTKLQFVYDYMGRRVEKKVFDGDTVVSHNRFVYDDYKQVEELDALNSNSVLKRYSWQPEAVGLDVPLSMTDVATAKNYAYTLDANKNVSDLTDALGNVVAHYEYSPFGTHVATGSYTGNPFRFSSEVFDSETGLIYYNYRYYNPNRGRWINRDPIEEEGGYNLYSFIKNHSIILWDYLGQSDCKTLSIDTISYNISRSILSTKINIAFSLGGSIKICQKCCADGRIVSDDEKSINITASIGGGKSTFGSSFSTDGWSAEWWAGLKISAQGSISGSGTVKTNRCDKKELDGSICVSGNLYAGISGGGEMSLSKGGVSTEVGANVSGGVNVSVALCYTCSNGHCRMSKPSVSLSGSASINVKAILWNVSYTFWEAST